ncbi:DUF4136 domain-containing protein [Derxia gummosa]|uniref:DUF4136 domain-containing protein n=1 Tax=Derxia gummosa DSM 723 TaxID=1121388 RepID=A0A8B6X0S9_9BURK|nr:DUF4136 domain-containing protein [Derxia gummosa]
MTQLSVSRLLAFAIAVVASFMLGACATTPPRLRAEVTAFSQWPVSGTDGATYAFERKPGQGDSLEHRAYEALVAEQLDRFALRPAADGRPARFTVSLDWSVKKQETSTLVTDWPDPPMQSWGFVGYSRFGQPVYGWRPWGWGGYWGGPITREVRQTLWRREMQLNIREAGAKVWEGRAVSDGRTEQFSVVAPYLARALFDDFPGVSGRTRTVEMPMDAQPASLPPGSGAPAGGAGTEPSRTPAPVSPATAPATPAR